jgi:hypothetical protein
MVRAYFIGNIGSPATVPSALQLEFKIALTKSALAQYYKTDGYTGYN